MAVTYKLIETITVGSGGAASIEFGSIPQTYTDLKVVLSLRSAGTRFATIYYEPMGYRFNSATTGYTGTRELYGNGSTVVSGAETTLTIGGGTWGRLTAYGMTNAGDTASVFTSCEMYIPNYTASTNKSFSFDYVQENNATGASQEMNAVLWSNTSAITTIAFALFSENFVQYSSASLYGIKNS